MKPKPAEAGGLGVLNKDILQKKNLVLVIECKNVAFVKSTDNICIIKYNRLFKING